MKQAFQRKHENQQRDQEQAEGRHVARAAALEMVSRQLAGIEEQGRQGLAEAPVQVGKALDPLPDQMQDRAVLVVAEDWPQMWQ